MTDNGIPLLVAHRGDMQRYPENTWLAIEAALDAGACWVEFDIQMCSNGEFILLHDDSFARTAAMQQNVFDADSDADTISVHEPARFGEHFFPLPVNTLCEVMQAFGRYPAARAMVEIKQESIDRWGLEPVVNSLLAALAPFQLQCCVISYNADALHLCRQRGKFEIGWVMTHWSDDEARARTLQADYLICNARKIPAGETLPQMASQWMVYDITDADTALDWGQRGAALVETGDIGSLLRHPLLGQQSCAR